MSRKLGAVVLALGILLGAMSLKTALAARSQGTVMMANGSDPMPTPPPPPKKQL
jgi:hypothetical protein